MKYGRLNNSVLEYAPKTLGLVANPTPAQYRTAGYKPVFANAPAPKNAPAGFHWERDGWLEQPGGILPKWKLVRDASPTLADYDAAMEDHLREEREARGYTTREPDAYLSSSNPRWAHDARDWVAHRDAVMEYALGLMNAVSSGARKPPAMEEFEAGLPAVEWTYAETEAAT